MRTMRTRLGQYEAKIWRCKCGEMGIVMKYARDMGDFHTVKFPPKKGETMAQYRDRFVAALERTLAT